MSRVLALVGNRPDVCGVAAKKYASLLRVETHGKALGWGIGFYQSGEALLRRRPLDDREVVEIAALNDISSGLMLAQIRTPGVGALRTENTPPFRYRDWLFAQRGTMAGFDQIRRAAAGAFAGVSALQLAWRDRWGSHVLFFPVVSGRGGEPGERPHYRRARFARRCVARSRAEISCWRARASGKRSSTGSCLTANTSCACTARAA
jgi:glutamine amidotransferase